MVIADACGHPDCANMRDMLKHAEAIILEQARELGRFLAERDEARAKLSAAQERLDDWHKVADRRSAEIIRLMGENEALRAELAKGGRD